MSNRSTGERRRTVALIGFPSVGKSSLAYQFVEQRFDDEYCTTIENHLVKQVKVGGEDFKIELLDTMGVTELPAFPDKYLDVDGWILVYSVDSRRSFKVLQEVYDKIRLQHDKPPLVVVGNKTDLETSKREIPLKEGQELAESFKAGFCESSAKADEGVGDIFKEIIMRIEPRLRNAKKDDCAIL